MVERTELESLQVKNFRIRVLELNIAVPILNFQNWELSHLEGADGGGLEPEIRLEVLGDLPDQPLEGQLPDEQLRRLLVATDLTQGHSARAVPVGLLDATGGGGRLPGCLGGQLLPGGLASGGLTGGLLGTGHGDELDDGAATVSDGLQGAR